MHEFTLCLPRLTLSLFALANEVLAPFLLGHIVGEILAFHKVTPRYTPLSCLEPQRYCFHGLNSKNLQNFTTISAVG